MTDWTHSTGRTGTMMIRDTGTTVEFWLKAAADTYNYYGVPWSYTANGKNSGTRKYVFPTGGAWQKLGSVNVTTDQTVYFYLYKTGTTGLGGPTTFSHKITRTSVPPAPSLRVTSVTDTTASVNADSNGNGGLSADQVQLGYGTSSSAPTSYFSLNVTNGYGQVTGLTRGKTYYFWARIHNAKGWGSWSRRVSAKTWTIPSAPTRPVQYDPTQNIIKMKTTLNSTGGAPILETQIGIGSTPNTVDTWVTDGGGDLRVWFTNLTPGKTYYFWARTRNSVGWSANSVRGTGFTVAGAKVKVGNAFKAAVPYVNVGGVWKLAQPWVRKSGVWMKTK